MTIREHFQRFHKCVTYVTVAGVVLAFVLVGLRYPNLTRPQHLMIGLLSTIPVAGLLFVFLKGRFKCPRCGADLEKLRRAQGLNKDRRMVWELWNACPSCGVSFDEPYSKSAD